MKTATDPAILVVSCDHYRDLWEPFFTLFERFWVDCPFPVYLLSNTVTCSRRGVTALRSGRDVSWSDSLAAALRALPAEYVFLFLDDLFLVRPVENLELAHWFRWLEQRGGNCLRLNGSPRPDRRLDARVGVVSRGTLYRTSTVLSLWKRQVLLKLLAPGESAWEFEIAGSARSDAFDGFYATSTARLQVINTVIKGKWRRTALARVRALGVEPDLGRRPVMTRLEHASLALLRLRTWGLNRFPPLWRRRVRELALGSKRTGAREVRT